MQNKKRTGFISILIIILCLSVCIGATYAYFTDSVKSEGNIIKSGKLDVTMEWANGTTDPANTSWTDASTGAIFNYQLWEPGYTDVRHIRIENVGTLAFQYKLVIVANGEVTDLADVIDVYYCDPAVQVASRTDLTDNDKLGTLTQALAGMDQTATGNLKASESVTITIALKMQENADNKYQNLSIGTDFSIQLYATQYTYESDAFDNQYDCLHAETEVIAGYPATYEETGLTDGEKCAACGIIAREQEEIPMLDDLVFTLRADKQSYSVKDADTLTNTKVVIPATYNGLPVTEIANNAFSGREITSVEIPNSVTRIGNNAFAYSYFLTNVTIPESVTSIGYSTFIESSAYQCENGVCYVDKWAVGDSNDYCWEDMPESVILRDDTIGMADNLFAGGYLGLKELFIPNSVKYIGKEVFKDNATITNVTIGNGVESLGNQLFYRCKALTSVTFAENSKLTSIGSNAFYGCTSLTSITIPEGVTNFGRSAFQGCSSLTSIIIPEGVTSIDWAVFQDCSSLTSIIIPEGVTSIGYSAFSGCASLTSITIPERVTSIDLSVFSGCSSLTSITIPEGVTSIGSSAFSKCSRLTSITIPEGVTSIGYGAFSGCASLTSITIPNSITSIAEGTFGDCTSLMSVIIPNGVTTIGQYAFDGCSSLTSITIPDGVTSIEDSVFCGCSSLTSIVIPDGVTSIGYWAFENCTSLTSITIPDSVTKIGGRAFNNCSSLTSISIPDSVVTIGTGAFSYCSKLTSIIIPSSVTQMGCYVFEECTTLTSIIFEDTTSTWYCTLSEKLIGGEIIILTDASTNVTYFKSTYPKYYWYKK